MMQAAHANDVENPDGKNWFSYDFVQKDSAFVTMPHFSASNCFLFHEEALSLHRQTRQTKTFTTIPYHRHNQDVQNYLKNQKW